MKQVGPPLLVCEPELTEVVYFLARRRPGGRPLYQRRQAYSRSRAELHEDCSPWVNSSQRLVHSGNYTTMLPRQQHKVSVGDLPTRHDSHGWQVEIRSVVRPEFVPREGGDRPKQVLCRFRRRLCADSQVETEKRALRDGACRKPAPLEEPGRRARVQSVFGRSQRDEGIAVEQVGLTLRHRGP